MKNKAFGYSLIELTLALSVGLVVGTLAITSGSKLLAEADARNAADEILMLRDAVVKSHLVSPSFAGLTTATFLASRQAPAFLPTSDNSALVIASIKASITLADERASIPGVQKPSFAIFVRDLSTSDCSVIAARLGSSFADVIVNGASVVDASGARPDLIAARCSSLQSENVIKLIAERTDPWIACRNYGTQYEEDICPVGFTGVITYSREYSCAANAGFEPGSLGPRTETKRVCCQVIAPQTEVRSDCPAGYTGTKTWSREYSCAANAGNEPGAWNSWHVTSNDCKADCPIPWGGSIVHGANVRAWQAAVVPFGSTCQDETRTCDNGTLSGFGYANFSCSVAPPAVCPLPWGGTVAHGSSATAYATATVPYGSSCSSESRPCFNGTLSGSYTFQNCAALPPPDACDNISGVQSGPPANGYVSGSSCLCNAGYTLNASDGTCSQVNTVLWAVYFNCTDWGANTWGFVSKGASGNYYIMMRDDWGASTPWTNVGTGSGGTVYMQGGRTGMDSPETCGDDGWGGIVCTPASFRSSYFTFNPSTWGMDGRSCWRTQPITTIGPPCYLCPPAGSPIGTSLP